MSCDSPIKGFASQKRTDTGKRQIVFNSKDGLIDRPMQVPCGKCLGCQRAKANEWALRCQHETESHDANSFVTLTYDDEHLPSDGGLHHSDFQKFIHRLRKRIKRGMIKGVNPETKIKYFMCGEYGESFGRPHFHVGFFGIDFPDKVHFSISGSNSQYTSEVLTDLWPLGFHTIGSLNFATAQYTAKYSMKQQGVDYELLGVKPPYRVASNGIGKDFALKFSSDYANHGNIMINEHINPVPEYYIKQMSDLQRERIKDNRMKEMFRKGAIGDNNADRKRALKEYIYRKFPAFRSDPNNKKRLSDLKELLGSYDVDLQVSERQRWERFNDKAKELFG